MHRRYAARVFPFWEIVVEPAIMAARPKRVVEIGALRGDTTVRLLEVLGEVEFHVIDPDPQFDPDEHQQRYAGSYVFHRDLSVRVLPDLEPVDVALIDGDHNWYTVTRELELLTATARRAACPAPVCILHDVGWPYGRRDCYYDPSNIPQEFKHANAQIGLERGNPGVVETGINSELFNALREGGPRNGVRTGLEDFIANDGGAWTTVVVDAYPGIAVAVDSARLQDDRVRAFMEDFAARQRAGEIDREAHLALRDLMLANRVARQG
jgi:hypothetical protein